MPVRPTTVDKPTSGTRELIAEFGPLYTRREVAPLFKLTVRSIDTMLANGTLPHLKVGGAVRFRIQDIAQAIEAFTVTAAILTPGRDATKPIPGRKAGQKMKINGPD